MTALAGALLAVGLALGPAPDVPSLVANPSAGPVTSTIAVTAHFPYVDCPMKGQPSVVFFWDGVTLASAPMNGRCDVATTVTPPPDAGPGVHAVDAAVVDQGRTLVARGLFTVETPVASAVATATGRPSSPPAGTRSQSSRYALFTLLCAALVVVALLRWRRASRRRR